MSKTQNISCLITFRYESYHIFDSHFQYYSQSNCQTDQILRYIRILPCSLPLLKHWNSHSSSVNRPEQTRLLIGHLGTVNVSSTDDM